MVVNCKQKDLASGREGQCEEAKDIGKVRRRLGEEVALDGCKRILFVLLCI